MCDRPWGVWPGVWAVSDVNAWFPHHLSRKQAVQAFPPSSRLSLLQQPGLLRELLELRFDALEALSQPRRLAFDRRFVRL